jgi:2-succinyl-5-enolpyruvyl-6-hydroxy-3-cyclohexene-1-carboxylate synthase
MSLDARGGRAPADVYARFFDTLSRLGVQHVCICPGSRSTPLAEAAWGHERLHCWRQIDERSAAFFALGIAKAQQVPAAVICTSGTAVANLLPAAVEAMYSYTPLLLLTADRPAHLHGIGSLQTIDQHAIFGRMVRLFLNVLEVDAYSSENYLASVASKAVKAASGHPAGPVHLNFPFDEPLIGPPRTDLAQRRAADRLDLSVEQEDAGYPAVWPERGLIVCGPQADVRAAAGIADFAAAVKYPILAEPFSQVRFGRHDLACVIDGYDLFLRDPVNSEELRPEVVLRFGATPVSVALLNFLAGADSVPQITVDPNGQRNDPTQTVSRLVTRDPVDYLAHALGAIPMADRADGWLDSWRRLNDRTRSAMSKTLQSSDHLNEPGVFTLLSRLLPDEAILVIGTSMPTRDADAFLQAGDQRLTVLGNRGANGIDGTISLALGAAAAERRRVIAVVGDVSFLHDLSGLIASRLQAIDATIVVLNNSGGGIFHFLPQLKYSRDFEALYAMPVDADLENISRGLRAAYARVQTGADFEECFLKTLGQPGISIVEVVSDRAQNLAIHREIVTAVKFELASHFARPQA